MPLLAEQEKEYLVRCQMGDVEARNALIEHNLKAGSARGKEISVAGSGDG